MRRLQLGALILVFLSATHLQAAPPQQGACLKDVRLGQVICAPPGGGISQNKSGETVCGPGACVRDPYSGKVHCSSRPGGFAEWDRFNWKFACTDGCIEGSASYCQARR